MLTSTFNTKPSTRLPPFVMLIFCLTLSLLIALSANAAKGGNGGGKPGNGNGGEIGDPQFVDMVFSSDDVDGWSGQRLAVGSSTESVWKYEDVYAFEPSYSPNGEWIVYRTQTDYEDGSTTYSVNVADADELNISMTLFEFDVPFPENEVAVDGNTHLWINFGGQDYLLINHYVDDGPFYFQLVKLYPVKLKPEEPNSKIIGWEIDCLPSDMPCSELKRHCNPAQNATLPTDCFSLGDYWPSVVDYGLTDDGYAIYFVGMNVERDPRPRILDRYQLFKIPVNTTETGSHVLSGLVNITPDHNSDYLFNSHRVIGVTASKINPNQLFFATYYYEERTKGKFTGELRFVSSSVWKGDSIDLEDGVYLKDGDEIIDTYDDKSPDYFIHLDLSCDDSKLLLANNDREIKLFDISENNISSLFSGSEPKWHPVAACP